MAKHVKASLVNVDNIKKLKCPLCGKEQNKERGFYKSKDPRFQIHDGRCYYCKDCLKDMCFTNDIPDKDAFKNVLKEYLNLPYYESLYRTSLQNDRDTLGVYISQLNIRDKNGDATWDDGETDKNNKLAEKNIDALNVTTIITDDDIKVEKDVIRLLGYDPFDGYSIFDKKFLNGELLPYLDEDTLNDQFKISVIIQIINNNNQIRNDDLVINQLSINSLSLIKNSSNIKSLTSIKKSLNDANDKLSKENNISVKNRGDASAGKSTLTHMMKNYRELGFEDAEQDYYDQNRAYGMKMVADLSNKSIMEQLQFDENDINEMLLQQKQIIERLQIKVDELEEENRILYVNQGKYGSFITGSEQPTRSD